VVEAEQNMLNTVHQVGAGDAQRAARRRAREAATAWRWWGFEGPVLYTQRLRANAALCV
jgi:hypothetical protein